MNKYEIAKFCAEKWAEGSGFPPEPEHEIQYLGTAAGVPIESWVNVPDGINAVPIPEIIYDPHDFSAWGEGARISPGIQLDPENKLITVACVAMDPTGHNVLSHFLFTWA